MKAEVSAQGRGLGGDVGEGCGVLDLVAVVPIGLDDIAALRPIEV